MNKVIIIGRINKGKQPIGGETGKNQALIQGLTPYCKVYGLDFYRNKQRPWIFLQTLWTLLVHPKATLILSSTASNVYPLMRLHKLLKSKRNVIHWCIGGKFADYVAEGKYSVPILNSLDANIVESDAMRQSYDRGFLKFICNTLGRLGKFKLACLSNKNYSDFKMFYPHTTSRCIVNGRAPITPTDSFSEVVNEMNSYRHTTDSKLFVHVARFHPVKNQSLLVESFNELINEGANVDLVVIGANYDCEDGIKLQQKANKRIHFIGAHKNISDYILNADIFCLSSDYEGMPITLLEASLAGVPAVSTPVCGAIDLIQNGVNGYLSKDHSLAEYKTALLKAMVDFEELKGNAMKMKGNSPYTIAECAKKYIEYFEK